MLNTYALQEKNGTRSATLFVSPAEYQTTLIVASVVYFDKDGAMQLRHFFSPTGEEAEAKAKAEAWVKTMLFPDFTVTLRPKRSENPQ
jgi:hypothetical protein